MGILSRAALAAGAFYAIHKYRKFNAETEVKAQSTNSAEKPFKQDGATSENTMPDVGVTVERSTMQH
tara:strand:+ start:433 stop:633 length:201 start_codon:yes stop_codon:yes gene_type:complete